MISFRQYVNIKEAKMVDDISGTFMEYKIKPANRKIPMDHLWLDIIRTPNEEDKNKGGATRMINNLKSIAITNNLPILLDPIGTKARQFFRNRGFNEYENSTKYLIWRNNEQI